MSLLRGELQKKTNALWARAGCFLNVSVLNVIALWQLLSKWHNISISLLLGKLMVTRRKLSGFILERPKQRQETPLALCPQWSCLTWAPYTLTKPWFCKDECWDTCNLFQVRHHGMRLFSTGFWTKKESRSLKPHHQFPESWGCEYSIFPYLCQTFQTSSTTLVGRQTPSSHSSQCFVIPCWGCTAEYSTMF